MSFRTSGAILAKDPQWAIKTRKEAIPGSLDGCRHDWEEFNQYAGSVETRKRRNDGYHRALATLEKFYVPENVRVLEFGSGTGDLLAAVWPRRGLGIDILHVACRPDTRIVTNRYRRL